MYLLKNLTDASHDLINLKKMLMLCFKLTKSVAFTLR